MIKYTAQEAERKADSFLKEFITEKIMRAASFGQYEIDGFSPLLKDSDIQYFVDKGYIVEANIGTGYYKTSWK